MAANAGHVSQNNKDVSSLFLCPLQIIHSRQMLRHDLATRRARRAIGEAAAEDFMQQAGKEWSRYMKPFQAAQEEERAHRKLERALEVEISREKRRVTEERQRAEFADMQRRKELTFANTRAQRLHVLAVRLSSRLNAFITSLPDYSMDPQTVYDYVYKNKPHVFRPEEKDQLVAVYKCTTYISGQQIMKSIQEMCKILNDRKRPGVRYALDMRGMDDVSNSWTTIYAARLLNFDYVFDRYIDTELLHNLDENIEVLIFDDMIVSHRMEEFIRGWDSIGVKAYACVPYVHFARNFKLVHPLLQEFVKYASSNIWTVEGVDEIADINGLLATGHVTKDMALTYVQTATPDPRYFPTILFTRDDPFSKVQHWEGWLRNSDFANNIIKACRDPKICPPDAGLAAVLLPVFQGLPGEETFPAPVAPPPLAHPAEVALLQSTEPVFPEPLVPPLLAHLPNVALLQTEPSQKIPTRAVPVYKPRDTLDGTMGRSRKPNSNKTPFTDAAAYAKYVDKDAFYSLYGLNPTKPVEIAATLESPLEMVAEPAGTTTSAPAFNAFKGKTSNQTTGTKGRAKPLGKSRK